LNERIDKDKVPGYYWSLKEEGDGTDFGPIFRGLFGIDAAVTLGTLPKDSITNSQLMEVFIRLKKEKGVPCVLVVDDAQRLFLNEQGKGLTLFLQECYRLGVMTTIFLSSEGSIVDPFRSCKLIEKP
jgi:hypothetical protein